jgi:AcrR family transcriptional regulator
MSSSVATPQTARQTGATAPRGRYAKSEQVQGRIVQAAAEVFAKNGFHATTFKEIARRAGVSERGLAYHFPTKEALLEAVMNDHHHWRSAVVLAASGLASFAAVLAVVEADALMPDVVGLQSILIGEATARDHPAHDHYRSRYADFRTYLSRAFSAALDDGAAISQLDADELAAGLVALLDGLQVQWLYDRDAIRVGAIVDGYLAAILSGDAMADVRRIGRELLDQANARATALPQSEPAGS